MAWLHLDLGDGKMVGAELTGDDGEVIAIVSNVQISVEAPALDVYAMGDGPLRVARAAFPYGEMEITFHVPNMTALQQEIYAKKVPESLDE